MTDTAQPLRQIAHDRFVAALTAGQLAPGAVVSQRKIMQMTDMPLGAVREMVPRLEAEGLIQTQPKRGLVVPQADVAAIRDVFDLRALCERQAFLAMARRDLDRDWLDRAITEHRQVIQRRDVAAVRELGHALHREAARMLGNHAMGATLDNAVVKTRMLQAQFGGPEEANLIEIAREHLAILRALQSGNPSRLCGAVTAHLASARRRVLERLPEPDSETDPPETTNADQD